MSLKPRKKMRGLKGETYRGFGRLIGVSDTAVRKAEKAGRIVLHPDGSIDVEASKARWAGTTDPVRQRASVAAAVQAAAPRSKRGAEKAAAAPVVPPVKSEAEAFDSVTLVKRVLQQEGEETGDKVDFQMARTAESVLKSRERALKLAERRKELVPIAEVRSHVAKAFVGFRQAIQRIPVRHAAAIAAELGVDAGKLDKALQRAIQVELEALSAPVVRAG